MVKSITEVRKQIVLHYQHYKYNQSKWLGTPTNADWPLNLLTYQTHPHPIGVLSHWPHDYWIGVCMSVPGSSTQERLRKPSFPEERGRWQWTRFNVTKCITEPYTPREPTWYSQVFKCMCMFCCYHFLIPCFCFFCFISGKCSCLVEQLGKWKF